MPILKEINNWVIRLASWATIFFMAVIAIVIPYEVFGRYVIGSMSTWSGEVSTYSLVWASMMGGAVGLKKGYQVGMTTVLEKVPPFVGKLLQGAGYFCMFGFLGIMVYFGALQTLLNQNQTSPAMGIIMSLPYAALPIGFLFMFLITLEEFLQFLGLGVREE